VPSVRLRPCIDLRDGRVVQIVGGTLSDADPSRATVNFATDRSPAAYARLYRAAGLPGGHVIALGPGNRDAMLTALRAFPGGMHAGGGVTPENAPGLLDAGASHVIVTSYVFRDGAVDRDRLAELVRAVGKARLVLDLSCRWRDGAYWVVTDRWQKFTDTPVTAETLARLAAHCDEFLVHGVDVEGKQAGIDERLVALLGEHAPIPTTYAGGVRTLGDLECIRAAGRGRVDVTVGSALDLFGGALPFRDAVAWHRRQQEGNVK
jgi:phosphoribosylformimino-5-aminoimidazole carboxamide ribotide isomerase